jgi:hypothetical protein
MIFYPEPGEFSGTRAGNKAVYRTRMAIADGAEHPAGRRGNLLHLQSRTGPLGGSEQVLRRRGGSYKG